MGTPASLPIGSRAEGPGEARRGLLRQGWFLWPLALRLAVWLFLAHAYEMAVFEDASWRMVRGEGVYGRFATWWSAAGDGYYAYPPLYAYMLWASGWVAALLGGHWWVHQLLIKAWLVLADAAVMAFLSRTRPAARAYWTLWFIPLVAIGQVQPDLWVGLSVVLALRLALRGRWAAVGLLLALGAGLKPVPLILLPFLAIYLGQRKDWKAVGRLTAAVVGGTLIVWLPYAALFGDWSAISEVVRFQISRPAAGLTVPSGLGMLMNAGVGVATLLGRALLKSPGDSILRLMGMAQPVLTVIGFTVLIIAAGRRRWPLTHVFSVPLLAFLLMNKVVHEHYLLQVLPLLLIIGINCRNLGLAYAVYLVTAGSPLRFFAREFGLPTTVDALLPLRLQPTFGVGITIGLMVVTALAAIAFSWQVFKMLRSQTIQVRMEVNETA